jgi:hypothetical protein
MEVLSIHHHLFQPHFNPYGLTTITKYAIQDHRLLLSIASSCFKSRMGSLNTEIVSHDSVLS